MEAFTSAVKRVYSCSWMAHPGEFPAKSSVALRVNGEPVEVSFAPYKSLLELLREDLQLTGTKHGCELGECGACAVLVDGRPVLSCLVLALECGGRSVETIEAMASVAGLHPLQKAFADLGAAQCGYCTPGFLLTARALLEANPAPTPGQIRSALAGNICRCTGYVKIFEAVDLAAAWMRGEDAVPSRETLYGTDFDDSGLLPVVEPGIGNRESGIAKPDREKAR
jgi:carbon-monoxide dehydrogenase small subunit